MHSQLNIYNLTSNAHSNWTDVRNIGRMVWPDCCVVYLIVITPKIGIQPRW